jgi:putative sterol carrier protein
MSEKDFHAILDKDIGVKYALMSRRIRIEGGMTGVAAAQKLVNNFL